MALEVLNITKDKQHTFDILEEAYTRLYMPAFPHPDTREDLDKFKRAINGGIKGIEVAVEVLGENLMDPRKRVLKGFAVAYYYVPQNVGLLAYNVIAPEHREKGVGKILVQGRIEALKQMAANHRHKKINGVFVDVNDPTKVAKEDDVMDPSVRVAIFESWGAVRIPLNYVQPPLSADTNYSDIMCIMNYPVDGEYANKRTIELYLRGIYREYRSDKRPEDDYFFMQQKRELDALDYKQPQPNNDAGYLRGTPTYNFL